MRATLLAAILAVGAIATAQAQVPHQRADGLWVCPNDESRIIVNGDWRIACYANAVPSIPMEEFKRDREQWQRAHDAEAARQEADRIRLRCKEEPRPSFCK
jgi:hypothetical protein